MIYNDFRHKDTWFKYGEGFCVEIVRNSYKDYFDKTESNIWTLYCYVYKSHPLFDTLEDEGFDGGNIFDFHGGCTYSQWYRNADGEVETKKYGCDYNHYGDEHFNKYSTPDRVLEIFADASRLIDQLSNKNTEEK